MQNNRVPINQVKPGMVLANPVLAPMKKIILLTEGTVLTQKMIDYLGFSGCRTVEVLDKIDDVAFALWQETQEFQKKYETMLTTLGNVFDIIKTSQTLLPQEFKDMTLLVLDLSDFQQILKILNTLEGGDENTIKHSLNVGLISGALAKWMSLSEKEIYHAVLTGLIHDVGKTKIPDKILNKPDLFVYYEKMVMHCHPLHSFHLIRESTWLPDSVKQAVLQHHERLDGSGYPEQLEESEITLVAQIVAVADVYEAITSPRSYRPALPPTEAMNVLMNDMFGKLNPQMCSVLTEKIKNHIVGDFVVLSSGQNAQIISFGNHYNCRPLVKLNGGEYLDLEKHPEIIITQVVDF